mgnify:CR=1 FL=1
MDDLVDERLVEHRRADPEPAAGASDARGRLLRSFHVRGSLADLVESLFANLAQSLHLLNSSDVQNKLAGGQGRAATLAREAERPAEEKIRGLYLRAFSRQPVPEELQIALAYLEKNENKQQAFEDILWALINTKEFLFNH